MSNFQIEQLKRLRRNPTEIWQGAIVQIPMPKGFEDADDPSDPCYTTMWRALGSGVLHTGTPIFKEDLEDNSLWNSFVKFATDMELAGYLPGRVEVMDEGEEEIMGPLLKQLRVELAVVDELSALEEAVEAMEATVEQLASTPVADIMSGEGVTLEAVKGFAAAAAAYHRAQPWERLSPDDLLQIEKPAPPRGMAFAVVLGMGGQTYGLGFYDTQEGFTEMQTGEIPEYEDGVANWSLTYDPADKTPEEDVEIWRTNRLPLSTPDAFPIVAGFLTETMSSERADVERLAFVEAVIRAITVATEEQLDSGRWSVQVETSRGPVDVTLALPDVLDPPSKAGGDSVDVTLARTQMERTNLAAERFLAERKPANAEEANKLLEEFFNKPPEERPIVPLSPREQAMELCFDARELKGRRQLSVLKKALELDPDCAEALVIQAENASTSGEAMELYVRAIKAGERSLGKEMFERDAGHFWGITETRPYMRAMLGAVQLMLDVGDPKSMEAAAAHMAKMLRLNPMDNQGVRFLYPSTLMALGRDADAARFMKSQSEDEISAAWLYTRAILAFRLGGDCSSSREELRRAMAENPFLPEVLEIDPDDLPRTPASYAPGSVEEALTCLDDLAMAFNATPEVVDWICDVGPSLKKQPRKFKERKKRKR